MYVDLLVDEDVLLGEVVWSWCWGGDEDGGGVDGGEEDVVLAIDRFRVLIVVIMGGGGWLFTGVVAVVITAEVVPRLPIDLVSRDVVDEDDEANNDGWYELLCSCRIRLLFFKFDILQKPNNKNKIFYLSTIYSLLSLSCYTFYVCTNTNTTTTLLAILWTTPLSIYFDALIIAEYVNM